ncbi:MAG: hypothetical protein H0U05_02675 [Actinobacteria bacterium]|nr:hypothetical protein [Actinomycetota bacterium]
MVVRIAIWSLFDSKTTRDELRESLADLDAPSAWLWNEGNERFGAVSFGGNQPEAFERARELIGRDPDAYEEFDAL